MTTAELQSRQAYATAQQFEVPEAVAEFLHGLMEDHAVTTRPRIARCGNSASLKIYGKLARKAPGIAHEEIFYWDGQGYMIGFNYLP